MKVIEKSIERIIETNVQKRLELCGRTCYNSLNVIKDGSDALFLKGILKNGHTSVLEHDSLCLCIDLERLPENYRDELFNDFLHNGELLSMKFIWWVQIGTKLYMSANIRGWKNFMDDCNCTIKEFIHTGLEFRFKKALNKVSPIIFDWGATSSESNAENDNFDSIFEINDSNIMDYPKEAQNFYRNHKVYTYKIICSRACQNQLVRHRLASFSVQSQRYCNYTKEKFGGSINYITNVNESKNNLILKCCENSENAYNELINNGCKPEDAREVLPNATSTIMIMSAPYFEWQRVFNLRCDSHAQDEIREVCMAIENDLKRVIEKDV